MAPSPALAALAASAVLLAAAPSLAEAPVEARPGEVCVLRGGPAGGSPAEPSYALRDNGTLVATVGQDYFCYAALPGAHRITVEAGARSAAIALTVSAGQRTFLQQSTAGDGLALTRLSEAALAPSPVVTVAPAPPPPAAPPAPPRALLEGPRPRPDGMVYAVDAGIGLASSRTAPAKQTATGFAALGSVLIGIWPSDVLLVAGRLDASLLNGAGVAALSLHLGLFPAAGRAGWRRDFTVFVDAGLATPIAESSGASTAPSLAGMGRIGVGVPRWRVGPARLGPLLCGQIVRSSGEADAAVLGGVTAFLGSQPLEK